MIPVAGLYIYEVNLPSLSAGQFERKHYNLRVCEAERAN